MDEKYIERIFWLAVNSYHEGRGEVDDGIVDINKVVLNRTVDRRWPNTVKGVILQDAQFSWTLDKKLYPLKEYKQLLRCAKLAFMSWTEWKIGMRIKGANHYYNPSKCSPSWASSMDVVKETGGHIFLKA